MGGSVTGFVYFEPVDDDHESVELKVRLIDADNGAEMGVASMRFDIE